MATMGIAVANQYRHLLCVAESRKYPAYEDARVGSVELSIGGGGARGKRQTAARHSQHARVNTEFLSQKHFWGKTWHTCVPGFVFVCAKFPFLQLCIAIAFFFSWVSKTQPNH